MGNNGNVASAERYEGVIKRLRGVLSARVVLDKENNFEEIHVLADTDRNPKVIVRDIETALLVNFGVEVDHKIVSVVQMAEDNLNFSNDVKRPRMTNVSTNSSTTKFDVAIGLELQEKTVEGQASGVTSPLNRLRLTASAALDALTKLFSDQATFAVDEVSKVKLSGREIVIVSVFMISKAGEELLLGASFIRGDEQEAAAKAALCAVNRKLGVLKQAK